MLHFLPRTSFTPHMSFLKDLPLSPFLSLRFYSFRFSFPLPSSPKCLFASCTQWKDAELMTSCSNASSSSPSKPLRMAPSSCSSSSLNIVPFFGVYEGERLKCERASCTPLSPSPCLSVRPHYSLHMFQSSLLTLLVLLFPPFTWRKRSTAAERSNEDNFCLIIVKNIPSRDFNFPNTFLSPLRLSLHK